ncbi:MAG TPA: hypothetical protein VFK73_03875 [Paludibacter sp.]|nr:hypothetical protein [Paludibacter sp.]
MKRALLFMSLLVFVITSFGQTKVTSVNVNFRSTPELKNNKICIIPKGTVLAPIDGFIPFGRWIAVQYKGVVGYVNFAYVNQKSTASPRICTTRKSVHKNTKIPFTPCSRFYYCCLRFER